MLDNTVKAYKIKKKLESQFIGPQTLLLAAFRDEFQSRSNLNLE